MYEKSFKSMHALIASSINKHSMRFVVIVKIPFQKQDIFLSVCSLTYNNCDLTSHFVSIDRYIKSSLRLYKILFSKNVSIIPQKFLLLSSFKLHSKKYCCCILKSF